MLVDLVGAGSNAPEVVNVIVEIPAMGPPIKYEIDKNSGALVVDRIIATPMFYPCHYGFIPGTLADDGDPFDVLVYCPLPLQPGCVIPSRIIGLLEMEDESGYDCKALAVPHSKISSQWDEWNDLDDIPPFLLNQIKHFFEHYKELEAGKWVKVQGFQPQAKAHELIAKSMRTFKDRNT